MPSTPQNLKVSDGEPPRPHTHHTLKAILPFRRRAHLAGILTDDDVEHLRHLATRSIGKNALRALASDLSYLEAWSLAATGEHLSWPAPEALLVMFVRHHLWDLEKRAADPAHGMPVAVAETLFMQGFRRVDGPHSQATVRRRLSSWASLTRHRGHTGFFNTPELARTLKLAATNSSKPKTNKSRQAVTADILTRLVKTCASESLADLRDRALLLASFAAGGRRRSEMAALSVEQLVDCLPVPADLHDPDSEMLPCLQLQLSASNKSREDDTAVVHLIGPPVYILHNWLKRAAITEGPVFRAINRWGHVQPRALTPQTVNLILKRRCVAAGLDPKSFSAHGLRAGYLAETARQGIPLPEAMRQSGHRSVQQAVSYYNQAQQSYGRAARILSLPHVKGK